MVSRQGERLTSSGGGGGEYTLGTATLTLRGDLKPLEADLAKMRRMIADMERRQTNIPAPKIPPPSAETQSGFDRLQGTLEQLRKGITGDSSAWDAMAARLKGAGAAGAGAAGGIGGAGAALGSMVGMAGKAIPILGQLGLAAAGVKAVFGAVSTAIGAVIGPLQALTAETALFNRQMNEAGAVMANQFAIFADGKIVEGTARQMRMVRGTILDEYKYIQKEVANISGSTAAQIYDSFNIIMTHSNSLGDKGTPQNASKLATRIAAGMNTFGIPQNQMMQETNALMMGNIDPNAMLAQKLEITSSDVKEQQKQGKYYDFLMGKLETLYEGQKELGVSLQNVMSNFESVSQTITAKSGVALEASSAAMLQTVLTTFQNLQSSFEMLLSSLAEAVAPLLELLGPVLSVLTSIGSVLASVGGMALDVIGAVSAVVKSSLLAPLVAVARSIELIAKGAELAAKILSDGFDSIKVALGFFPDESADGVNKFFDNLIGGIEQAGESLDRARLDRLQNQLGNELGSIRTQGEAEGLSEFAIKERQDKFRDDFIERTGLVTDVELRSLKLSKEAQADLDAFNAALGTGSTRALNVSKQWAEIKTKGYQNEIKSLEQGLGLMTRQKAVAEAMAAVADARRAFTAHGFELGVQVSASPEAKAAAVARLNNLKFEQEKEAIQERKGLLQSEREMQQRQMAIQEKQLLIQQEQLKIAVVEAENSRNKGKETTQELLRKRGNTRFGTPAYFAVTAELNAQMARTTRDNAILNHAKEARRLGFEAISQLGTINSLEQQRMDLQLEQLGLQEQGAQYTLEQQRLMAEIAAAGQDIANTMAAANNEATARNNELNNEKATIQDQLALQAEQVRLDKARTDLAITRGRAAVQEAERLQSVQQAQASARSGGGVVAVVEAQIAAAAAGVTGMETAAEAQERLYAAKEAQMEREHRMQQEQLRIQQLREQSELRIQQLTLQSQQVEITLARAKMTATLATIALARQQDALGAAIPGQGSVPGLGSSGGGAVFGATDGGTGRVSNAEGYVHGHFQTSGTLAELLEDVLPVVNQLIEQGVDVTLMDGTPLSRGMSDQQIKGLLRKGAGQHGHSGDGRSLDLSVPVGTAVPVGLSDVRTANNTADGINGLLPGSGKTWLSHLAPGSTGGAGASTASATPAASNIDPKILAAAAAAYKAGFRGEALAEITAVAFAESSYDPTETNMKGGDRSYGLWQINMKDGTGPERRQRFGLASNEDLFDPDANARAAFGLWQDRGFQPWRNSHGNANYMAALPEARQAAAWAEGGGTVGAAGVGPSLDQQQAAAEEQGQQLDTAEARLNELLAQMTTFFEMLNNRQSLGQENMTEAQLAEREQFDFEQETDRLRALTLETPTGQLAASSTQAITDSIAGSIKGGLQALMSGGDIKQALLGVLSQAGQTLMEATVDSLLNPMLAQLQGQLFKTLSGVDIEAVALQNAAGAHVTAAGALMNAAAAIGAAAAGTGAAGGVSGISQAFSTVSKLASLAGGLGGGISAGIQSAGAAAGAAAFNSIVPIGVQPFTAGFAGGGEARYGLDYLVGEGGPEIVRFNRSGGKVTSNRQLSQALGVPFQRAPGGKAEVAGETLGMGTPGVPFARTVRNSASPATPGIPFIRPSGGERSGVPFIRPGGGERSDVASARRLQIGDVASARRLQIGIETQVINGVEYATVEQVRQAANESAEAGRESAYTGIQNNPSVRRALGM